MTRPERLGATATEFWLAGFLAIAVLSTLWSVEPLVTFLKAVQLVVAYLLVALWVRTSPSAYLVDRLGWVAHTILLAAAAGLVLAPGRAMAPISDADPTLRLGGIFPAIAPDLLGFVAVVGLLYLAARVGPSWTLGRGMRFALAITYVAVLLLTRARTSLVLLPMGLLVLLLQDHRRRGTLALFLPIVGVGIVCVLSLYSGQIAHFVSRGENSQTLSTLTGRTDTWQLARTAWLKKPFTGYGFYAGHRLGRVSSIETQNLDNMWVETLLDTGMFGVLPLAAFVAAGGLAMKRWVNRGSASHRLAVSVYVVALLSSFVNPSLQQANYPMILFATVLLARPSVAGGITAAVGSRGQESSVAT
jgi:O-antigen ligase